MSPKLRFFILQRDGFTCRYCGAAAPEVRLHVDHVLARANGGTDDPGNLVAACQDCNLGKSSSDVIVLPWQRQMAVLGLLVDWLISPFLDRTVFPDHPVLRRLAILSDFALGPEDPAYLWEAVKDIEDCDEAIERLREVELGPRFDA